VQVASDDASALNHILSTAFDPYRTAIITGQTAPDLPRQTGASAQFQGEFSRYGVNSFEARVTSNVPVLVVFEETYYPGWHARLDGEPVTIWKANYAFRGVVVPPGEHIIAMDYYPRTFDLGWKISAGTLAVLASASGVLAFRRRRRLLQTAARSRL
jgi:hypothetical protein